MGSGSYTSADWAKLRSSAKITERSNDRDIFKKREMDQRFDPKYINVREARDGDDHPESTPIIIGLDVTGSMGYLAAQIAKEGLNETMMKLFSTKPVTDPQIMLAALGDVVDSAPLQVTQFESDIRIAEQLMDLWLEGRGGDSPEDYNLLWYFAAKHTSTDCFEKRGKKGYIFTIGDADCHRSITGDSLRKVFGEKEDELTLKQTAEMAKEKYELFHIHISNHRDDRPSLLGSVIPGRIITVEKAYVDTIPELIVGALLLAGGQNMKQVVSNWPEHSELVQRSLSGLVMNNSGSIVF